ncbi:hypothetical protein [Billgrantia kenyensis]|uniref:Uncharacterized protein n=1 Tax=Billgrantia kenyensis TaxID=321266 RepID=A0A7V9W4P0_9GAMM|nr:hypothetical protein [Halomonas kenyensis]MBA2781007.1 hypothetical protein [Halomonas kenyensis]MCG6663734.1 hypothetical protein [Halomonas kenyensis]
MSPCTPLRCGLTPLALGIPLLLTPIAGLYADEAPVATQPISIDSQGEHYRYRLFMEIQGEEMYWTLTQGPDLTLIHPEEEYETRLGGWEDLYVGPPLDNLIHRFDAEFDLLVPAFGAEQTEPPLEFEGPFGRLRRVDAVDVHVTEIGETREIAGREAHAYRVATVTANTLLEDDANEPYHGLNHGTAWVFEDLPFSPAALQPSPGLLRMAIAPGVPGGLEAYYLDKLIAAFEPHGMIAELELRDFHVDADNLEALEGHGWDLEQDPSLGQAQGESFQLTMTEFAEDAQPLDYATLENSHIVDAAAIDYLKTPPGMARRLDVCPPLPADMPQDALQAAMEENASFRGSVEGLPEGDVLGEAAFGSQEDDFFGDGFLLTAETYLPSLDRAACLILLRVGAGLPEPGTLEVASGEAAVEGTLEAYFLVGDVSEPGEIVHVAVGRGVSGEIRLDEIENDRVQGELEVEGQVTPLDNLNDTEAFRMQGDFDAHRVWDQVPTRR